VLAQRTEERTKGVVKMIKFTPVRHVPVHYYISQKKFRPQILFLTIKHLNFT